MLAICRSATLLGVRGTQVHVEVHVSAGVPGFSTTPARLPRLLMSCSVR